MNQRIHLSAGASDNLAKIPYIREVETTLITAHTLKDNIKPPMKQLPIFDESSENLKRYYSISEVAAMFEVSKSTIRFWENEFDMLKPHKNSKGDRMFTPGNIQQLRTIFHLVKERGFTLDGAKKELKAQKERMNAKKVYLDKLLEIKKFLVHLKEDI
ncbi:MAG: hypothetical protein DHS20C18_30620 [Saprospiraceae bacterium]|nr:MAG: hypothetical protein DHS20C18_30620 [Saprospiraceae bacterium]